MAVVTCGDVYVGVDVANVCTKKVLCPGVVVEVVVHVLVVTCDDALDDAVDGVSG